MAAYWTVIVNVPGFMPEAEPIECGDWLEACDTLAEELQTTFETDARGATETDLDNALALVRAYRPHPAPFTVQLGPYAHSVERG